VIRRAAAALLASSLAAAFAACGEPVLLGGDVEPSRVACVGLPCGAPCLPASCPPDAGPCDVLEVRGACDPHGTCVALRPMCPPPPPPCEGKHCGDACEICDPMSPGCMPMPMACDMHGMCDDASKTNCMPPYDPCKGLPCMAPCKMCAPDDPGCMEPPPGMAACDPMGKCVLVPVMCSH
jgi:hypothetical protein